jgi:hypothetical protein
LGHHLDEQRPALKVTGIDRVQRVATIALPVLGDDRLGFSIGEVSQISCKSAGPRGPAVKMFVLSATGDPVAFVNLFSVDMMGSSVVSTRVH